jgi:hypothetical protein
LDTQAEAAVEIAVILQITLAMVEFLAAHNLILILVVTNLATQTVAAEAAAAGIMEEELVLMEELV